MRSVRPLRYDAEIGEAEAERLDIVWQLHLLKKAFETANVGITISDTKGRIINTNPAEARMHGYEVEELVGRPVRIFAPADTWNPAGAAWLTSGEPLKRETVNIRKDGTTFPAQLTSAIVRDKDGMVVGAVTICEDITERKIKEAERIRLAKAVESSDDSIVIVDTEGMVLFVNPAFERITGYRKEEIIGRPGGCQAGEGCAADFYGSLLQRVKYGRTWRGHLKNRRKDGSHYEADIIVSPIRSQSGEVENYVVVERDITEKTRLESLAEAINTMNNIGYVFSGIRHEIGNPINSIKTTISVLDNNLDGYSRDTVREYLCRVMAELGRVEYLLRAMKSFNMDEGTETRSVEMPSFIEKFESLVKGDFEKRGIGWRTIVHPEVSSAYVDPRALHQALLNVMTNACDACEGRDDPKVVVSVFKQGQRTVIRVMDNGCGIPAEHQDRLFMPFYTTKGHGTGLGLTIVKKMLAKMDCTIDIESLENAGTIVDISIPGEKLHEERAELP